MATPLDVENSGVVALDGVYLRTYLKPFLPWLERDDVTEILVNKPFEVWIEISGEPNMRCVEMPEVDDILLSRLAAQIARVAHQGINRENPLLAASLPTGERVQLVGPPASKHWAMAIRRHRMIDMSLDDYDRGPVRKIEHAHGQDEEEYARAQPIKFLKDAVTSRKTILISGGTSSGKTTFLNAMLKIIPEHERIILVEDTAEIADNHANSLRLVAVKGELGEAKVTINDLLQASLRLRPDRIIVGEIRGEEAQTFLRAINTGHPGSFTTAHANTPKGALEQIALMVMQGGTQLTRSETLAYATSLIDVVVQLNRVGGERVISDIYLPQ
ncbi:MULTISPECIES: P-type DNA transfer ATPase VirB11 [Asticcacaulis]|uniref:P-type DNA transfer ATPase VirB11 n=1 Tax=Asticcacaulis TaxID=76890 RepID=UPI001AE63038|nr:MULTISPECIES: P-type DNA transfer ATPase VirB11 [Asticcacaulis]MBP2161714.1 type IV secretion system protein VirB11 [Asticcacaulis solisilvae]MDR6802774.1 type IV secretion system protein VirB11 [Asticcacaulis sp. BE141]